MATIYGGPYANTLKGTAYADFLYGLAGNDFLYGYGGDDKLDGGTGADRMYGGIGNDTYIVDSQYDAVVEYYGQGTDIVRTSTSYALNYGASIERLETTNPLGTSSIALIGNDLHNIIVGNNGANSLHGGAGLDTLIGGGGSDLLRGDAGDNRLTGGQGADQFVFTDAQSHDTITDFVSGIDEIELGWLMHASQFRFIGSAAFSGQPGQGRFSNGLFQLDLNGDRLADLSITILGGQLQAGDFNFAAPGYWDY
jgi:Ca2+-binding RTX toxin-like protein